MGLYSHGDIFTVVVDARNESNKELDTIRKILRKSFVVNGVEVELSACICLVHSEHCTKGESELVKALDYSISEAKSRGKRKLISEEKRIYWFTVYGSCLPSSGGAVVTGKSKRMQNTR